MNGPFETDTMEEADAPLGAEEMAGRSPFDEFDAGESGDEFLQMSGEMDGGLGGEDYDDAYERMMGETADDGADLDEAVVDDMAVWNAFEEEIADGLDAVDDDEFFGRLLGGLGRAAGVIGRGMGRAAGAAGQVGGVARRAGRIAGQVGRVAGAVQPAALAAARLARMLGAPGAAGAFGQIGRFAQGVGRAAGHGRGLAGSLGQAAGGAQSLFGQLSQLLGQSAGTEDAFDAVADLYLEEGVDEALPAAVALAARTAARGLGFRNVAQLSLAGRRALVRGVAAAARELNRRAGPQAVRALPRLARSAARIAQRQVPTPQGAAQVVRNNLPQAARRVAQNPRLVGRLAQPAGPRPLARPTNIGRGMPTTRLVPSRRYYISGPATLTITPR